MSASDEATPTATANPNTSEQPQAVNSAPRGRGLAAFAIVLALLAGAGAAYVGWQQQQLLALPNQVNSDAGKLQQLEALLERRTEELAQRVSANTEAVDDTQSALGESLAAVAQLSMQAEQLEQQIARFSGSDVEQRKQLLKAEAVYYLRVANAQALLARDASVAARALQLADDKLREMADPSLATVRGKLSEELAALRAIPEVDTLGISFKLQALAGQVGSWPLKNPVPDRFDSQLPGLTNGADANAWGRVKQTVRAVFESIVSVRQTDVAPEVQLGKIEQALVIESVRAELQLARLAFINGQMQLYRQSLQRVGQQIRLYFAQDAQVVDAALSSVTELESLELPGPLPDVSGSLSLLLAGTDTLGGTE